MPWYEVSRMSQRQAFVTLAQQPDGNLSELCRRFHISRPTAYKWLQRARTVKPDALNDRSRRPQHSPTRTTTEIEQLIVAARQAHPAWGARKLRHWLIQQQRCAADALPAASTVHAILNRYGQIDAAESAKHRSFQRFEHAAPNQLWQMDFKGDFRLHDAAQTRCFALTVLDDHSRFALGLRACWDRYTATVQTALSEIFRGYGLPERMTMDNGAPWGNDRCSPDTRLTIWLMRLGVRVSHSRPYHPQTQGKDERFHRTLEVELLRSQQWTAPNQCQIGFDAWRDVYNQERPHEALGFVPPSTRYRPSQRPFPEVLPPLEYEPTDHVRHVQARGQFSFRGDTYRLGKAFHGQPIGLRLIDDDEWLVLFGTHELGRINRRTRTTTGSVNDVPEHL